MNPRKFCPRLLALILAALASGISFSASAQKAQSFLSRPPEWFRSEEGKRVAGNILSFQTELGDWPKNTDTTTRPSETPAAKGQGTFDNGATIPELRFLARGFAATGEPKWRDAFLMGLDHILKAQYPNGGWPQCSPARGYARHITFNDGTMVNLMNFVRDVASAPDFSFVDPPRRQRARQAFDLGVECILNSQVKAGGKLTAWCAQHDEIDLSPRPARAYELVSLSGGESAGLVRLLMSLEKPSARAIAALDAAVAWFEAVKLTGIKQVQVPDPNAPKGTDKRIVEDPAAPPLWARFYNIETMKPMFVDRDGVPRPRLADIGYERRNGYSWLGSAPASVLADYPAWRTKVPAP